ARASRVARAFLVYMLPPLPRCSGWASSSLVSPNRVSLPRFHVRVGLHIVLFEVCSAFTRVAACTLARSPYVVTAIRRLQTLRLLHVCSGRFRLERSPGGAYTHWKSTALSRRTWKAALPRVHRATGLRRFASFFDRDREISGGFPGTGPWKRPMARSFKAFAVASRSAGQC